MSWLRDLKARGRARRTRVEISLDVDFVVSEADRKARNQSLCGKCGALEPGLPASSARNDTLAQFLVTQALADRYPPSEEEQRRGVPFGRIRDAAARKIAGRIQNLLQRAVNDGRGRIEVDATQAEWLRDLVKGWECRPQWSGWWETLLEHLEAAVAKPKPPASPT